MAKLNQSLIISLSQELVELHEIGQEMIEHIGSCKILSWRFPTKLITDVDINILDSFNTTEKYILLLELVIDRLYLIVNLTLEVITLLPEVSNQGKMPKNVSKRAELSFGTLISLFWKRLKILMKSKNIQFSSKSNSESLANSASSSCTDISKETCTSCEFAMSAVKSIIKEVEECMKILSLQSSTMDNRQKTEKDLINLSQANAMQKWAECITEDVHKLTVHAKRLASSCHVLTRDMEKIKKENKENVEMLQKNFIEIEKLETENQEIITKLHYESQEKDELLFKIKKLINDLCESEDKSLQKDTKIRSLEDQIKNFDEKLNSNETNKEQFEKELKLVTTERDYWKEISKETKSKIEELENKIKSLHETLSELQDKLSYEMENDDEKVQIEAENEKVVAELERIKSEFNAREHEYDNRIQMLEEENNDLQEKISQCKERENILIRCPDLNGPIEYNTKVDTNPLQDMEDQLESNEIRIALLQEQNVTLRRTIEKMKLIKAPSWKLNK